MARKEIAFLIPVFNEEKNIRPLHAKLCEVVTALGESYSGNFLFVDDGSRDGTAEGLSEIAAKDPRVQFIQFSRNFGKEIATSAALHHAQGDAAILLDADFQHPPELIPEFLTKWERGAEVVVGIRKKNDGVGLIRRFFSRTFYLLMNLLGDTKMVTGSTDFRLLDAKVIHAFKGFNQRNRMTRNLIDWMGFKRDIVTFDAHARSGGGAPAFSMAALARLATTTIIANSLLPLRFAGYLGAVITPLSGALGFAILLGKYVFNEPFLSSFSGPAQLAILLTFLVGVVLICMGVMSMYIAQIHDETMGKPLYLIRSKKLLG